MIYTYSYRTWWELDKQSDDTPHIFCYSAEATGMSVSRNPNKEGLEPIPFPISLDPRYPAQAGTTSWS